MKYPTITFKSTRVVPRGADRAQVIGDLTIRDITREIVLDVPLTGIGKNPWSDEVVGFEAADLIVTSTHGRSGAVRWILGSVAEKVLHSTHLPQSNAVRLEAQVRARATLG